MLLCPWKSSFGYQSAQQCGFVEGNCTTNQETKECRPTQIETGENSKQKENTSENKKFRSVNIQIPEKPRSVKLQTPEPEVSMSWEEAITPQRLVSVDGGLENRTYINSSASIT